MQLERVVSDIMAMDQTLACRAGLRQPSPRHRSHHDRRRQRRCKAERAIKASNERRLRIGATANRIQ